MDYTIFHENEMIDIGKNILTSGSKILLYGDLGAGKTTLVKGMAAALGLDPDQVQSPTYTYQHIYDDKLLHIDMRRIESLEHLKQLGLLELMDQYTYIAIEWPKREDVYIQPGFVSVKIERESHQRIVTVFS